MTYLLQVQGSEEAVENRRGWSEKAIGTSQARFKAQRERVGVSFEHWPLVDHRPNPSPSSGGVG